MKLRKLKTMSQQWLLAHLCVTVVMSLGPAGPHTSSTDMLDFLLEYPDSCTWTSQGKAMGYSFSKQLFAKVLIGGDDEKSKRNFPCETLSI